MALGAPDPRHDGRTDHAAGQDSRNRQDLWLNLVAQTHQASLHRATWRARLKHHVARDEAFAVGHGSRVRRQRDDTKPIPTHSREAIAAALEGVVDPAATVVTLLARQYARTEKACGLRVHANRVE